MDAISKRVSGTTMRFTWTSGPTQGKAHDHRFGEDGQVEWRSAASQGTQPAVGEFERARYAALDVSDDVCLVSYLAKSGYTLTVALNFADSAICGVASNEKTWTPVGGAFEVLD
ncbi:MAG TPA: hypothetical protein VJN68_16345 [Burkholderiaceae bacterium]|nr:hypothetical protein [Burkholderiaceae bacterium]